MEMKVFEMRELKASESMVLTNGEAFSSVGGSVYLGINDSYDNWREITEEEYNEILTKQEQEAEE